MNYSGMTTADYSNVRSLNAAFLSVLRASTDGEYLRRRLAGPNSELVAAMNDLQLDRLASCPFLLVSFRERDTTYWRAVVADGPAGDLLRTPPPASLERLATAGLAFLWQLARRNTYAVRVVSGGDTDFCNLLTGLTLVRLLNRTARRRDLVVPRFAAEAATWSRLLGPGISPAPSVRRATQLSVMQAMLTAAPSSNSSHLRAAACASSSPVLQIAAKERRR